MVGVPAGREQVAYAQRRGLSQRRSCTLLKVARSALGYRSTRAIEDRAVLEYHVGARASGLRPAGRVRRCQRARTRCGRMTSCSTGVRTASN